MKMRENHLSDNIHIYLSVLGKIFNQSGPYFPLQKGWSAVQKDLVSGLYKRR